MVRRQQDEAEGMERLAAEYLTLAAAAQAERWDVLLAGAGFTEAELQSVRSSEALGQLTSSLRRAAAIEVGKNSGRRQSTPFQPRFPVVRRPPASAVRLMR